MFFKTVCDLYDLLPAENYKLPPEAEGLEAHPPEPEPEKPVPQILKSPSQQRNAGTEEDSSLHGVGRTNTRRHIRSSPSTGSAVTTVIEADESDADSMLRKVKELQISTPETVAEEPEVAEVPVIVDHSIVSQTADDSYSEASVDDRTVIEIESVEPESDEIQIASSDKASPSGGDGQADGSLTRPKADAAADSSSLPYTNPDELPTQKEDSTTVELASAKEEGAEVAADADVKAQPDTDPDTNPDTKNEEK